MTTPPTAPLTLDAAPEQLKVVAYLVTGLSSGEPSICFEDERGDYGDEDHMPVFDALCSTTEAQSALSAQAATIAQLEARLREAEAVIRDHNAGCQSQCEQRQQNGTASCPYAQYGRQCPDCPRDWLLDAAIAAHGKDGAHDR